MIDLRHWMCLCKLGRQVRKSPSEVLMGILEKTFLELHMIDKVDNTLDENLRLVRAKLARYRLQPEAINQALAQRADELLMLGEVFPEEVDKGTADLLSRLYYKFYPPELSTVTTEHRLMIDQELEERLNTLTRDLSPTLPPRYRQTFDREDEVRKRKKRKRG